MTLAGAVAIAFTGAVLAFQARSLRFPGAIAASLFLVLFVWNRLGMVDFGYDLQPRHLAYIVASLAAFGFGGILSALTVRRWPPMIPGGESRGSTRRLGVLVVAGGLGGMLWALDIWRHLDSFGGSAPGNLSSFRDSFLAFRPTLAGQVGSLMYGASLPALVITFSRWLCGGGRRWRSWKLGCAVIWMAAVQTGVAVLSGGRQAVLEQMVAVAGVVVYAQRGALSRFRLKLAAAGMLLLLAVGGWYLFRVSILRDVHGVASPQVLLNLSNGQIRNWAATWYDQQSAATRTLVTALHVYVPYNLTSFAVWLDGSDGIEHGWGRFQFLHVTRQLAKLGLPAEYSPSFNYQFPGTINWPTVLGSMVVDFGPWLTPVVLLVLGLLVGRHFGRWRNGYPGEYSTTILVVTLVCIVHGLMYSPFQEVLLFYGLLWTMWYGAGERHRVSQLGGAAAPSARRVGLGTGGSRVQCLSHRSGEALSTQIPLGAVPGPCFRITHEAGLLSSV